MFVGHSTYSDDIENAADVQLTYSVTRDVFAQKVTTFFALWFFLFVHFGYWLNLCETKYYT